MVRNYPLTRQKILDDQRLTLPSAVVGLFNQGNCGNDGTIAISNPGTYQCADLTGITHYQLYC